jgi:predicted Zn finger-like uncharacterized protein
MLVQCSGCGAKLRIKDEKVKPGGSSFKCPRCSKVLFIQKPSKAVKDTYKSPRIHDDKASRIPDKKGKTKTNKDKLFLIPFIIIFLIAALAISSYIQHQAELRGMRGAEWIDYDSEGRLYFTYYENVYRLSSDNASLEKIIDTGLKISSRDIMDIAIAPSGDIFLTDPTSSEIKVYSSNGDPLYHFRGHFKENGKLAVDDERIYIADMQGNRTLAIDIKKGKLLWTDRKYYTPDSLFVKNSVVYVSDKDRNEVRMLDAQNGEVIKNINIKFSGYPYGSTILVLDDDTILLAQAYRPNGNIQRFSQNGTLIQDSSGPDGFTPVDMAISPGGKVLITDDENYSFYSVNNDIVELVKFKGVEQLFGDMQRERTSLKKSAFNFKLILVACVIVLIGLFVIYKRYTKK